MFGFSTFYSGLFIVLIMCMLAFKCLSTCRGDDRFFFKIICVVLLILAACRGESVGGDLDNYLPHFDMVKSMTSFTEIVKVSGYEPGYCLLVHVIGRIIPSERFFLIITSVLSLLGPFYVVKKYSRIPYISLLLYIAFGFYTNTFNNVRQALAISIILFSVPYILDRKFFKFIIIVLLASTVHLSAIFFPIVYVAYSFRITNIRFLFFVFVIPVFVFLFGNVIIDALISIFFTKYDVFDREAIETLSSGSGYALLAFYIIIAVISYIWYVKICGAKSRVAHLLMWCMMLSVCVQSSATVMATLTRLAHYFFIFVILFAPLILSTMNKSYRSFYATTIVIVAYLYFMVLIMKIDLSVGTNSQAVVPYIFLN